MKPLTIGIILAVYALFLWVLVFFVFHKGYKEWKSNRAERIRKFNAKVMDRRDRIIPANPESERTTEYLVTFDYAGRQKEFTVDPEIYEIARIGQEGALFLKSENLVDFQPKSDNEKADDLYGRMVKR